MIYQTETCRDCRTVFVMVADEEYCPCCLANNHVWTPEEAETFALDAESRVMSCEKQDQREFFQRTAAIWWDLA